MFGKNWIPAECDVSIRPGWFYHENENMKVKTADELFALYLKSVGRGASLLLNVPPDRDGLINENDSASLVNFKKLRDNSFQTNLVAGAKVYCSNNNLNLITNVLSDTSDLSAVSIQPGSTESIAIDFLQPTEINCISLSEQIQQGQRICSFTILLMNNNEVIKEFNATTIGVKRILTFPTIAVQTIMIKIKEAKATALISEVAVYKIDNNLVEKK